MEEAVRRELLEEVNLQIGDVTLSRHPALAVSVLADAGLSCPALSKDFTSDGAEIAEARWITKDEARARLANEIVDDMKLPAPIALPHRLIQDWASR